MEGRRCIFVDGKDGSLRMRGMVVDGNGRGGWGVSRFGFTLAVRVAACGERENGMGLWRLMVNLFWGKGGVALCCLSIPQRRCGGHLRSSFLVVRVERH